MIGAGGVELRGRLTPCVEEESAGAGVEGRLEAIAAAAGAVGELRMCMISSGVAVSDSAGDDRYGEVKQA